MLSDVYAFTVLGDSADNLHMLRTDGWCGKKWEITPELILTAVKGSGGHRLYYLCGTNPYKGDRPCRSYPLEVDAVWASYNPGNLVRKNVCDVAADLLAGGLIKVSVLDENGKIDDVETDGAEVVEAVVTFVMFCGEPLAFFRATRKPGEPWSKEEERVIRNGPNSYCTVMSSYAHVGQHGEAASSILHNCRRATVEEYGPLMREMTRRGYHIKPHQRGRLKLKGLEV